MLPWDTIPFGQCLIKHGVGRENQINTADIQPTGRFPVVDQGQAYIAGYTDDAKRAICTGLPYVIFGDHTRLFKYVDFPFVLGADGTKVLKPNPELFDARFFYYAALALDIPGRGYNRHYTLLKRKSIPHPDLSEQRSIAELLATVQGASELQERLAARARELRTAVMHTLFTQGAHGEVARQSEIGPVPQSWPIRELREVSDPPEYGFTASASNAGNTQILRITDIQDGRVNWPNVPRCECSATELTKYRLHSGDMVFARIGATAGKSFLVLDPPTNSVFASYLIRIRPGAQIDARYLAYFCQTDAYWRQIAARKGANLKGGFHSALLRRLKIPVPPTTDEQAQIAATVAALDWKIDVARRSALVLDAAFQALLHQLMAAELRVQEIEFPALVHDSSDSADAS